MSATQEQMPQAVRERVTSGLRPAASGAAAGPVFSINFIRHHAYATRIQKWLAGMAGWYLLINAVVAVVLVGEAVSSSLRGQAMRAQAQQSGTAAATPLVGDLDMERLHQRATEHLVILRALIARQQSRFPIAGKLAAITTTLPARTWLTGISGDRAGRTLTVRASYLVNPEAPYDLPVNGWIESLKSHPRFGQGLQRLELGASSRERVGSATLVTLELLGAWR